MGSTHRVMAVDDNPRNLTIVAKSLRSEFELVTCQSGEEALELAPQYRPDLILLDVMMPGIDGYETCRRLRALKGLASTKIIMVTARATTSDRLEGYKCGANDYVTKPFDPDELLAKLGVYCRLKSVEEVDRTKTALLTLLGHETRTPLTTILSPAAILLDDPALTEQQRRFVTMIQDGGMQLLALIEKVTYLSELKSGLRPATTAPLDATTLLSGIAERYASVGAHADIRVDTKLESGVRVDGNAAQLERALAALIDNAMRVSPRPGLVSVTLTGDPHWVTIGVADAGPGISPDFIDHIFDEFSVTDIAHHGRGHGLSLATARLIAEQHGGRLTVESSPGQGATFRLLIPRPVAAAAA